MKKMSCVLVAIAVTMLILSACTRQEPLLYDHPLVGAWASESETKYMFYSDGSGVSISGLTSTFTWSIEESDNVRVVGIGDSLERVYSYAVDGNSLTLTFRIVVSDISVSYVRLDLTDDEKAELFYVNRSLIGIWATDESGENNFTFNNDGVGSRNLPGLTMPIEWSVERNNRLRISNDGEIVYWTYEVGGDVLVLTSEEFGSSIFIRLDAE